ncbi:hypothetical protein CAPTEDRAFT_198177 [Capitella teleta]|uniref:Uncharacterized protein n=1 Tax=Capitella teleta TaxID=283909 RepID=X1ZYC7_CAPTE|nr:hypothetical protein CAPTEDRAFT_198177 [Capitella teleta]|eukprot:ELU04721.1 hypothetical protein CAPTEDRAFT_198177 [Capitella teleta]
MSEQQTPSLDSTEEPAPSPNPPVYITKAEMDAIVAKAVQQATEDTANLFTKKLLALEEKYKQKIQDLEAQVKTAERHGNQLEQYSRRSHVHEKPLFHEFADSVVSHGFLPQIIHPRRFTDHRGTLLDNFFCKLSPAYAKTMAGIMTTKLSDHQGCFVTIDCLQKSKVHNRYITITKKVTDFNKKVCDHICDADLLHRIDYERALKENYQLFEETLQEAISANTETKRVKVNKYKQKKKHYGLPWAY